MIYTPVTVCLHSAEPNRFPFKCFPDIFTPVFLSLRLCCSFLCFLSPRRRLSPTARVVIVAERRDANRGAVGKMLAGAARQSFSPSVRVSAPLPSCYNH